MNCLCGGRGGGIFGKFVKLSLSPPPPHNQALLLAIPTTPAFRTFAQGAKYCAPQYIDDFQYIFEICFVSFGESWCSNIYKVFCCIKKSLYSVSVFLSEERSKKYEIKVCAVSILVSATLLHARLKEGIEHLLIE